MKKERGDVNEKISKRMSEGFLEGVLKRTEIPGAEKGKNRDSKNRG